MLRLLSLTFLTLLTLMDTGAAFAALASQDTTEDNSAAVNQPAPAPTAKYISDGQQGGVAAGSAAGPSNELLSSALNTNSDVHVPSSGMTRRPSQPCHFAGHC